jgi:hypothetical protein
MTQSALEALHTSPELLFELAAGVENLSTIAARYELDEPFLKELMATPGVKKVIAEKRKELDDTGYTLAQKAKLCFEDLLSVVYKKARLDTSNLSATLAAAEFFRKVAGLDKMDPGAVQDKFSITINLGSNQPVQKVTIDTSSASDASFTMPSFLLEVPQYVMPGDADRNADLAYVENN